MHILLCGDLFHVVSQSLKYQQQLVELYWWKVMHIWIFPTKICYIQRRLH